MSGWTHAMCSVCWYSPRRLSWAAPGGRRRAQNPIHLEGLGSPCCFCASGLADTFVREDPLTVPDCKCTPPSADGGTPV